MLCVVVGGSLSWLWSLPWCEYSPVCPLYANWHLGSFSFLAITESAALKFYMHSGENMDAFLLAIPLGLEFLGHASSSVDTHPTGFQSGCTILLSCQQCMSILVAPYPRHFSYHII